MNKITNLVSRKRKEKIFIQAGKSSIFLALAFLIILFSGLIFKGATAFFYTRIAIEIDLSNYSKLEEIDLRDAIKSALNKKFITKNSNQEAQKPNSAYELLSKASNLELKSQLKSNLELIGKKSIFWLGASSKVDMYFKHQQESGLSDLQLAYVKKIEQEKAFRIGLNFPFFIFGDSREAEIAGIAAGAVGSFFLILVFLATTFPIAVMSAFYLEEFAPKNKFTNALEVSINNLAAIPSIIYGLLGLVLYLQFLNLPRSSAIVGGLTLSMLALPIIIIATRSSIRRIPKAIRDGAMALGATKLQLALHHLLPLSLPGIMTGSILAISRAIGETAPLLMIGMIAFVADIPTAIFDPSSALPVQIYLWSDLPEAGFAEKTCAAILILLAALITLNISAAIIRKKFEKKW